MSEITVERMNEILREGLHTSRTISVVDIGPGSCEVELKVDSRMGRPGGTLSGPAMMGLADAAMWVCVMSQAGEAQLAVTTNLNINFLKRPPMKDVIAEGRTLKFGKRLVVIEVALFSADDRDEPIAHATGTYSIPPGHNK